MGADAAKIQKEEQKKIDEAQPLSEEELVEKDVLLTKVNIIILFYFYGYFIYLVFRVLQIGVNVILISLLKPMKNTAEMILITFLKKWKVYIMIY